MRTFVVAPPESLLTLDEVREHLKEPPVEDDNLIRGLMSAAQGHIDGPAGWLGRAIGVQTIEARFDNWDCGSLRLPYPPHIDIVSVSYVGADGAAVDIDAAAYELLGASLQPAFGASWPSPRWQREAVRVRYRAGYAVGQGQPIPMEFYAIRAALLIMVDDLYHNRGGVRVGASVTKVPMSTSVEALLGPLQVFA